MNGLSSWIKMEKANIINLNIKEDYRSEIIIISASVICKLG